MEMLSLVLNGLNKNKTVTDIQEQYKYPAYHT
jgi:hypothetical protein